MCSQVLQAQRCAEATSRSSTTIRCKSSSSQEPDAEAGPGPGSDADVQKRLFLEMFRRHNSSLRHLEGQVIGARVFKTDRRYVWLHTGYNAPVKYAKKSLDLSQLISSTEGGLRASPEDFRVGDVLQFTIQDLETPYGDMQLAVERPLEKNKFPRVWQVCFLLAMACKLRHQALGMHGDH